MSETPRTAAEQTGEPPITVIEPKSGWRVIDFKEIFEYRDLFWFLIYRAVRSRYAQSALGLGWAIIQPVATTGVFAIVFGGMLQVDSEGAPYAVFSFAAMVPWTYFQNALNESVTVLTAEQNMLSKIYFPRLVLPLSRVLARLIDFSVAFVLLMGVLLFYGMAPNWGVIVLPVLIFMMVATAAGVGMFLSAMSVQYRDINYGMSFLVRLFMYAAPVVYGVSAVTNRFGETARLLYGLNPMVGVIEGFRSSLLGTVPMPWDLIAIGGAMSVALLLLGAFYFRRKERVFADVA
jgi:lipopolysaccharide transport system permease protein